MQLWIALSAAFVAAWVAYAYSRRQRGGRGAAFPPGPPRLPIFGNIFQLGLKPQESMAQLAKTYGPLMSLKLGAQLAVVVSSPEMVNELLRKQDAVFADHFCPDAFCVHRHEEISMATAPATSDRWKRLRRVSKETLFSNRALQASNSLRRDRLQKLVDYIGSCSGGAVGVAEATFTTTFNSMSATLFSVELTDYGASDSAANQKFRDHIISVTRDLGLPNISDFFPIFLPLDLQGIRRKMKHHLGGLLEIIESMIEQRLQARNASSSTNYQKKDDFLETLLDLMEGNKYNLSIEEIKHLCVDLFLGGTESSAATVEWAMVELLLHPEKLAKLKAEVKSVVGERSIVEESDISRLPYLQATVKEVFRYHPVAPLLSPRLAIEETNINGYIIPKNTKIIINYWAITRDPNTWNNPECFEPERFLAKDNIDYGGQHSELIPFGLGRRICPGIPLVRHTVPSMIATLCHNFDWELEAGAQSKEFQREYVFGQSVHKKNPLRAIPIKI